MRPFLILFLAVLFTITVSSVLEPSLVAQNSTVVAGTAGVTGTPSSVEKPTDKELASPQRTMRTFINALHDAGSGQEEGFDDALKCLDLSLIPEVLRHEQGRQLAAKLYHVLNRVKPLIITSLPSTQGGESFTYYEGPAGAIVLANNNGNWVFSNRTISDLDKLYSAFEAAPPLSNMRESKRIQPLVLKIRSYVPPSFKGRTFWFEDWQWVVLVVLGVLIPLIFPLINWILRKCTEGILRRFRAYEFLNPESSLRRAIDRFTYGFSFWIVVHAVQNVLALIDLSIEASSTLLVALGLLKVGLFIYTLFALSDLSAHALSKRVDHKTGSREVLVPLTRRLLKIGVTVWGIFYAAYLIDFNLTGLVAGLGLGALAVALAAKDTLENFFGSVVVFLDRPFRLGDAIKLDAIEGSVEHIGIRSIRLRTPENSVITLPNAKLINTAVENIGARQFFRFRSVFGFEYGTTPEQLEQFCKAVRAHAEAHEFIRQDNIEVFFTALTPSSLEITINLYFKSPDNRSFLTQREQLLLEILKIAAAHKINFAHPLQTVRFDTTKH